ncbi:MAG: hypothetical protein AABY32_03530 [Nanoarchaeota archaeon]
MRNEKLKLFVKCRNCVDGILIQDNGYLLCKNCKSKFDVNFIRIFEGDVYYWPPEFANEFKIGKILEKQEQKQQVV